MSGRHAVFGRYEAWTLRCLVARQYNINGVLQLHMPPQTFREIPFKNLRHQRPRYFPKSLSYKFSLDAVRPNGDTWRGRSRSSTTCSSAWPIAILKIVSPGLRDDRGRATKKKPRIRGAPFNARRAGLRKPASPAGCFARRARLGHCAPR